MGWHLAGWALRELGVVGAVGEVAERGGGGVVGVGRVLRAGGRGAQA